MERILVTLPEPLIKQLTQLAQHKGLNRSEYIRMTLIEHAVGITKSGRCLECGWTRLTGLPPWECRACQKLVDRGWP